MVRDKAKSIMQGGGQTYHNDNKALVEVLFFAREIGVCCGFRTSLEGSSAVAWDPSRI